MVLDQPSLDLSEANLVDYVARFGLNCSSWSDLWFAALQGTSLRFASCPPRGTGMVYHQLCILHALLCDYPRRASLRNLWALKDGWINMSKCLSSIIKSISLPWWLHWSVKRSSNSFALLCQNILSQFLSYRLCISSGNHNMKRQEFLLADTKSPSFLHLIFAPAFLL